MIRIIESPREGMQGFPRIIPTGDKVRYINKLLRVGFDTVEIGSIVSPKWVPQMADSLDVLKRLDLDGITSHRMFLVVHRKGAELIAGIDEISHISFPFSFSPSFLRLNVNATVDQSLETAEAVVNLCAKSGKNAVIYISMAFGNPYGDPWDMELLIRWVDTLYRSGIRTIPLSNVSIPVDASMVSGVFSTLIPMFPDVEFGLHLHTTGANWHETVNAAFSAGCRRFDGVINGHGGCPMAGKEMLGNLKTEYLLEFDGQNYPSITL